MAWLALSVAIVNHYSSGGGESEFSCSHSDRCCDGWTVLIAVQPLIGDLRH